MNGPEHYTEAERLIQVAGDELKANSDDIVSAEDLTAVSSSAHALLAGAQVHATLAMTAAIADLQISTVWSPEHGHRWQTSLVEQSAGGLNHATGWAAAINGGGQ